MLPPPSKSDVPVDGFAGLLELRSIVSADIFECWGDIASKKLALEYQEGITFDQSPEHHFTVEQLQEIRRNKNSPNKDRECFIRNIYGKKPRLLRSGHALASLQISFSEKTRAGYTRNFTVGTDIRSVAIPDSFGLLDTYSTVKALDEAFAADITSSARQKGFYAIKDGIRLEYRSLPAYSFNQNFAKKIKELDL